MNEYIYKFPKQNNGQGRNKFSGNTKSFEFHYEPEALEYVPPVQALQEDESDTPSYNNPNGKEDAVFLGADDNASTNAETKNKTLEHQSCLNRFQRNTAGSCLRRTTLKPSRAVTVVLLHNSKIGLPAMLEYVPCWHNMQTDDAEAPAMLVSIRNFQCILAHHEECIADLNEPVFPEYAPA